MSNIRASQLKRKLELTYSTGTNLKPKPSERFEERVPYTLNWFFGS